MSYNKRPSKLRFLQPVLATIPFLIIVMVVDAIAGLVCGRGMVAACPDPFPPLVSSLAWAAFGVGVLIAAYLFKRDFYDGQYYLDLEESSSRRRY